MTSRDRVLDVGTGTGFLALRAAELGHDVTGVDVSGAMLAQAETSAARAGLAVNFVSCSSELEVVADRRFDAIVCRHLLWTLPQPERTLRRWREVLPDGGRIAAIDGTWFPTRGIDRALGANRPRAASIVPPTTRSRAWPLHHARSRAVPARRDAIARAVAQLLRTRRPAAGAFRVPRRHRCGRAIGHARSPTASRTGGVGSWSRGVPSVGRGGTPLRSPEQDRPVARWEDP